MKQYKITKIGNEQFNLVNIQDSEDWHWLAEDQVLNEGDIVDENSFILREHMFVDDEGYGKAPFAYILHKK